MRTTIITIAIAGLVVCAGIGCNQDNPTELAWINDTSVTLNEIIWTSDAGWDITKTNYDQKWTSGYIDGQRTEFKEVNVLNGSVFAVDDTGHEVEVIIQDLGANSLSLNEGSSEVYTIDSTIP